MLLVLENIEKSSYDRMSVFLPLKVKDTQKKTRVDSLKRKKQHCR
jgi:hypothetical protein